MRKAFDQYAAGDGTPGHAVQIMRNDLRTAREAMLNPKPLLTIEAAEKGKVIGHRRVTCDACACQDFVDRAAAVFYRGSAVPGDEELDSRLRNDVINGPTGGFENRETGSRTVPI
jgi:hypothetical protein